MRADEWIVEWEELGRGLREKSPEAFRLLLLVVARDALGADEIDTKIDATYTIC